MSRREFDIILWGATGFTGRLACLIIATAYGAPGTAPFKYAIAGRDSVKLEALEAEMRQHWSSDEVAKEIPKIVASVDSPDTMVKMCERTHVLVALAGPYFSVGEAAVKACVETDTHYVDVTGETAWVKLMQRKYSDMAQQKQLRIVPCCGYDYAVSDVPLMHALHHVSDGGAKSTKVTQIEQIIDGQGSGGLSSGTMTTALSMMSKMPLSKLLFGADPFVMCDSPPEKEVRVKNKDQKGVRYSKLFNCWTKPDIMGKGIRMYMHWSNECNDYNYGKAVIYHIAGKADSLFSAIVAAINSYFKGIAVALVSRCPHRIPHKPGTGPKLSLDDRRFRTSVKTGVVAEVEGKPQTFRFAMEYKKDMYIFAALCAVEAALTMIDEKTISAKLPERYGVLPCSALGMPLIDRLRKAGVDISML